MALRAGIQLEEALSLGKLSIIHLYDQFVACKSASCPIFGAIETVGKVPDSAVIHP